MGLSKELISRFVKSTNDKVDIKKETITYGTIAADGNGVYIDGSDTITPISKTADVKANDRVIVMIKNHAATIIGNLTAPSAGLVSINAAVENMVSESINTKTAEITEKLSAAEADIDDLQADRATINEKLSAAEADIRDLKANSGDITELTSRFATIENLDATNTYIHNLEGTYAAFIQTTTEELTAIDGRIDTLESNSITTTYLQSNYLTANEIESTYVTATKLASEYVKTTTLESNYAKADLANVEKADIGTLLANIGLITSATITDGHVTGYLDSVQINANDITAGTLTVDRLVISGTDKSIIYALNNAGGLTSTEVNTINGDVITKRTIAADHIIAGTITANELHSSSVTSDKIAAGAVTSGKISVNSLESIVAKIGSFSINNALYTNNHSAYNSAVSGVYIGSDYISLGNGGKTWGKADGSVSIGSGAITYDATKNELNINASSIKMASKSLALKTDIDAVNSKFEHDQLVINGGGELGDNTNFSSWVFDGSVCNNSAGSFTRNDTIYSILQTDEAFLVNPEKEYTLSFDAKTRDNKSMLYAFIMFLDADKNQITCENHMYVNGTLTTLVQDLKPGDTKVYLNDVSKWSTTTTNTHIAIFWCHTNQYGYTYPEETYSRVYYKFPTTGSNRNLDPQYIDFTTNTLTLPTPWTGATVSAGTKVSQGSTGATYKYILANLIPGTEWSTYTGAIKGIDYSGTNAGHKFPPGVTYAKIGFLWNINAQNDKIWVTNVSLRDTTEMTDTKDNILNASKTATDYLHFSSGGLVVGDLTAPTLGKNALIDSDGFKVRNGTTVNSFFGENIIELAKNNESSTISMLNGTFKIFYSADTSEKGLGIYGRTSTGEDRLAFQPVNENDNLTLGWGGYNAGKNSTNVYGHNIKLIAGNDMSIENDHWTVNIDGDISVKATTGSFVELIGLSSDNNTAIGHGGYTASLGKTNIYGNKINHIVKTNSGSATYKPYYEAGDSFDLEWYGSGFVSSSSAVVFFAIPLAKPVIGATTPTVTISRESGSGLRVRQNGSYVYGSASNTHAIATTYKTAVSGDGNFIRIEATMPNTTNAVNNEVCGIHAKFTITFS